MGVDLWPSKVPPMQLRVDGETIEAREGDDVLTALIRAGQTPGGSLCLTGDCPNCLAEVDGVAYVRMCRTPARDGLTVSPFPVADPPPLPAPDPAVQPTPHRFRRCDVVVVGGGRAGSAEAEALTAAGRNPIVLDESDGAEVLAIYPGPEVVARQNGNLVRFQSDEIVIATGSADLHPVVPGSQLAGILTPSAATHLSAAGVDLGDVVWVGPGPAGMDARLVEGRPIRFEGQTRVETVVIEGPEGEARVGCDTVVVELGTYPRDVLARMAGDSARVVGSAASPATLPPCPGAGTVCPCAGVEMSDLDGVWERGFRELELVKRATLAGTGTCQGGICSPYLRAYVADRGGEVQPSFTARPPARQLTLGEAADGHHFPPIQRTTLDEIHRAAGARMDRMGGWWRPWIYTNPESEYRAVREAVSLGDAGTLGKMLVRGPDAADFLDFLYPGRISDLRPGRSRYALLLAESGAVFDDGLVSRLDEDTFALTFTTGGAGRAEAWVRDWATGRGSDVRIMDRTHSLGAINVTGPRATDLMRRAGLEELPRFMAHLRTEVAGVPCRIYRLSFTGEISYELHHPAASSPRLWAELMQAGDALGVEPHGLATLLTLRLEKGHIIVGMDTEPDSTPRRLGMDWAVDFGKGDFLGRAALERTGGLDLDRRLSGFTLDGPAPTEGSPLYLPSGEMGGWVTSAAWSPTLGKTVALAWTRLVDGEVTDQALIDGRTARRTDPPFYDPGGERARA